MELFGIKIERSKNKGLTFVQPTGEDGAIEIETNGSGFAANIGHSMDLDAIPVDDNELLQTYRHLALQPEIDEGLQEIINEAIITEDLKAAADVVLDDVDMSNGIKTKIAEEFDGILKLLDFRNDGYGTFRRWYVDGRLFYHKVVDTNNMKDGISKLVPIDPANIKLVREYKSERVSQQSVELDIYDLAEVEEYYIYSKTPFGKTTQVQQKNAVKIPVESIAYVKSGLLDETGKQVLSYLYKSIKPYNNLKMLEDSVVIYRVTRAPERRVFYVDVGSLPTGKAEQYLKDVMNRFKNKIVYDVKTGTVNNRKKFQSMIEDFWLPRREGGRGTEVDTLSGGENLGELADVEYFKVKVYKSMNVPLSRFESDGASAFNIGRTTEITRDEVKFSKYIARMRRQFSTLFTDLLETQLLLKKVITSNEWEEIKHDLSYSFLEDNYFAELKEIELMNDRVNMLATLDQSQAIGKYYSHTYVKKEILKQSDEEIDQMKKEITEELKDEILFPPEDDGGESGAGNNFGGKD